MVAVRADKLNFTPLMFLDFWSLASSLRSKVGLFETGVFIARDGDRWAAELRDWTPLRNVLARVRKSPAAQGHEMGGVRIERLNPGEASAWLPPASDVIEVQAAIVTNPSCYVFAGIAALHLQIGHLTAVNRALPCCAVNWGETPRYHLILEFRKIGDEQ